MVPVTPRDGAARYRKGLMEEPNLFGPGDGVPPSPDDLDVRAWQFVNRWVFLPHQRQVALEELKDLIAEAKK